MSIFISEFAFVIMKRAAFLIDFNFNDCVNAQMTYIRIFNKLIVVHVLLIN